MVHHDSFASFRSFPAAVAAGLLPAHLTTAAPKLRAHLSKVLAASGVVGWSQRPAVCTARCFLSVAVEWAPTRGSGSSQ